MELHKLIILCPLIFIAGMLDAIVGSGSLIALPAYMAVGLPPHFAYGTNKFANCFGTITSALRYIKNKRFDLKSVLLFSIICMIGSFIGSKTTLYLDDKFLKYILMFLLPILVILLVVRKKDKKDILEVSEDSEPISKIKLVILSLVLGLTMGFYGGFLGVGITSFLILVFINIFKISSIKACGNARIVNGGINIVAMTTFLISGKVNFIVAIPAAISAILGNYIGAGLAIKKENKIIKPLFVIIFIILFIKLILEMFFKIGV